MVLYIIEPIFHIVATKRRRPGESQPRGWVKGSILLFIAKNGEAREPDIRGYLRDRLNVREDKGIKLHLSQLEEDGLILKKREKPGLENRWQISTSVDRFTEIIEIVRDDKNDNSLIIKSEYYHNIVKQITNVIKASGWKPFLKEEFLKLIRISPNVLKLAIKYYQQDEKPSGFEISSEQLREQATGELMKDLLYDLNPRQSDTAFEITSEITVLIQGEKEPYRLQKRTVKSGRLPN